jgi:hypothetical protein
MITRKYPQQIPANTRAYPAIKQTKAIKQTNQSDIFSAVLHPTCVRLSHTKMQHSSKNPSVAGTDLYQNANDIKRLVFAFWRHAS